MKQSWCVPPTRSVSVDCVVEAPGAGMSFRGTGKPGPMPEDGAAVMSSWLEVRQCRQHLAVARRGRQARGVS